MKYIQPIARMIECRLVTQGRLALLQLPAEWGHPTIKLEFNPDIKMREEYEKSKKIEYQSTKSTSKNELQGDSNSYNIRCE